MRTFLEHSHITLDNAFWKKLNRLKNAIGNSHYDTSPSPQELKIILSNANPLEKALFLTMVNTGVRENDIINIEKNDLHLNENPPRITIKKLNTTTKRRLPFAFVTEECKEAIELWLIQKDDYIQKTRKISNLPIKWETSNKLFPISEVTARKRWNNLLEESHLNEQSTNQNGRKQYIFHLYTLKKFFRSYLNNRDLAEYLIGHTNISNLYYNKNLEEIKNEYKKYSKNLYILTNPKAPENINEELDKRDKEITKLTYDVKYSEQIINKIKDELKEIKEEMNSKTKYYINPKPNLPSQFPTYHSGYRIKKGKFIAFKYDEKQRKDIQFSKSEQNQIDRYSQETNDPLPEYCITYERIEKENPKLSDEDEETYNEKIHNMTCAEMDKNKRKKFSDTPTKNI